jgi:hypothetical protein
MRVIKILVKLIVSVLAGVAGLYLLIAYVVIPIGVPLLARSQGSKLLAHEVSLGAARFNPFTLQFSLKDFKILDTDKQTMVGFKKFRVDVSFLRLLKKELRVESFGIDGLTLNVVLLPDNRINLLSLVPKQAKPPAQAQSAAGPAQSAPKPDADKAASVPPQSGTKPPAGAQPLPEVSVDSIILENGAVFFTDKCIAPGFSTRLSAMDLRVTGVSTRPDSQVKLVLKSNIDDSGRMDIQAQVKPFVQPLQMEASFSLNDYALRALTPYVGKYTGRAVKEGGKLDIRVDYRVADNKLHAGHKVLIQRFDFGEKVESKDALSLPFGLALALLEDTQNRIDISLPVSGDIADPQFEYFHLLGQVAVNFFMKLVTSPFKALLSIVPSGAAGTEELGMVSFAPGVSVLTDAEKQKLDLLAQVMKERSRLALEINGSYDLVVDWKEITVQAFDADFAARRKESSFTDLRVFEEMYKVKFGLQGYWTLARQYTVKGKTDEEGLKGEIRRRIIEEGAPDKGVLEALAHSRATVVYEAMIAAGFDPARVTVGAVRAAQGGMGIVPMEFTLTVFDTGVPQAAPPAGGKGG